MKKMFSWGPRRPREVTVSQAGRGGLSYVFLFLQLNRKPTGIKNSSPSVSAVISVEKYVCDKSMR